MVHEWKDKEGGGNSITIMGSGIEDGEIMKGSGNGY